MILNSLDLVLFSFWKQHLRFFFSLYFYLGYRLLCVMAATKRQHAASQQQIGKGKQKKSKKTFPLCFFFFFFRAGVLFRFLLWRSPIWKTLSSEISFLSFIWNIEEQSNKKDNNQLWTTERMLSTHFDTGRNKILRVSLHLAAVARDVLPSFYISLWRHK